MLKRINGRNDASRACVAITDASAPALFYDGLQYSPPARGSWNIVHTAMLVPESHQIYICALGCLRGVVLTAAEMGDMRRFSSIVIEEHHLYDGTMEDTIVRSACDILSRLPALPRVCFIYPSCVHHFMGCDMKSIYQRLRKAYPAVVFVPAWMDPIRRQSQETAEVRTRRQIYAPLQKTCLTRQAVNLVGSNLAVPDTCELARLLADAGIALRQLPSCRTYRQYEAMASSFLNIAQEPLGKGCLSDMHTRLGQDGLYLPVSFSYDEITAQLRQLADILGVAPKEYGQEIAQCEQAFAEAKAAIGTAPIAIDYTAVFRPFSLARALLCHDFSVQRIYTDTVSPDDMADFQWIQQHYPKLMLYATRHADMRRIDRHTPEPMLAIGQKAAYFTGTSHFVDMAEGGGLRDFSGLTALLRLMRDAWRQEKDARQYILRKGWGCPSCL